jgi:hypothetical protein
MMDKYFPDGKIVTVPEFEELLDKAVKEFGEDEVVDFLSDKIGYVAQDIVEINLHKPEASKPVQFYLGTYPLADFVDGNFKLTTNLGSEKQDDYVICEKMMIEHLSK